MKILWFCNTPCCASEKLCAQKGSTGNWLNTLSTELSHINNIELHIAFYWHQKISPFEYNKIQYHPIYTNETKNKLNRWFHRLHDTLYPTKDEISNLLIVIDNVKPDIIHVHGTEENFGLISLYIKKIPIVLSIQGFLSSIHKKLFSGVPQAKIKRSESFFSKINMTGCTSTNRIMYHKSLREKQILRHTKYVIGRTDFDKYCSLIYNPNRIYLKVNEIMRNEFFQNSWNKKSFSKEFTITTTISNGIYKGLEIIYLTAKLLKESNFNFKWKIIGLTSQDKYVNLIEKYLQMKAKDFNIELLGKQTAIDICTIFQKSDLYCQTSHIENSSNSTCEAMALGMPIIASFAGGTSSLITDKKNGLLVQDGDPFILAGAILTISRSFFIAKKLAIEAQKYALRTFSPQNVIHEILNAYNNILLNNTNCNLSKPSISQGHEISK